MDFEKIEDFVISSTFLGKKGGLYRGKLSLDSKSTSTKSLEKKLLKKNFQGSFAFLLPFEGASKRHPAFIFKLNGIKKAGIVRKKSKPFEVKHVSPSYEKNFKHLKAEIKNGNIYEANLCRKLILKNKDFAPFYFYEKSGRPKFFMNLGNKIISYSPEMFIEVSKKGERFQIRTEPMKGTLATKKYTKSQAKREFQNNKKLKQELMLITDMSRNDMAQVCEKGLMTTTLQIKKTSYAWQAVSSTKGTLKKKNLSFLMDLLPAASISGAPKSTAVKFINSKEKIDRGYYTGVFGILHKSRLTMSVLIRTLVRKKEYEFLYGVGGGIIWESDLDEEKKENYVKTSFLEMSKW